MFAYRGVEVTEESSGSFNTGGTTQPIVHYHATVHKTGAGATYNLVGASRDAIRGKIDEVLGPEKPATHS
jgi:hypothetical protein